MQVDKCDFVAPVGIEHFFDAFYFSLQRPWRAAACQALGLPSCYIEKDTHIKRLEENKFARTGVSCGSSRSKKWHNLGNVSLCKAAGSSGAMADVDSTEVVQKNPYEEKAYRGPALTAMQRLDAILQG